MPIYDFTCEECGKAKTAVTMAMKEDIPKPRCCKKLMGRNYAGRTGGHKAGYDKPILSDGLGVMPNQIPEAMKLHPDREYTPDGRLVMRSHSDRERYLKQDGYHDNN